VADSDLPKGYRPQKFAPVPSWIWNKRELSPGAKLVYGWLLYRRWHRTVIPVGLQEIADEFGVGVDQAGSYMKELRNQGLIVSRRQLAGPNTYQFRLHPWMLEDITESAGRGQPSREGLDFSLPGDTPAPVPDDPPDSVAGDPPRSDPADRPPAFHGDTRPSVPADSPQPIRNEELQPERDHLSTDEPLVARLDQRFGSDFHRLNAEVVGRALGEVNRRIVDEAVGYLVNHPNIESPRYLLTLIRDWARQRGVGPDGGVVVPLFADDRSERPERNSK
jgi:hypothetical protein